MLAPIRIRHSKEIKELTVLATNIRLFHVLSSTSQVQRQEVRAKSQIQPLHYPYKDPSLLAATLPILANWEPVSQVQPFPT